jgi:hypothetical protein
MSELDNLIQANQMLLEDVISNDSFSTEDMIEIRDRIGILINQLEFWTGQDNAERFCYDLKKHIHWMLENYS